MIDSGLGYVLLLDSGNTRVKCRAVSLLHPELSLQEQTLAETLIANDDIDQLGTVLQDYQQRFGQLVHAYGVSVAGEVVQKRCEAIIGHVVGTVSPMTWLAVTRHNLGLHNHYALNQIGKDRWYGVLGAYTHALAQKSVHSAFLYISFGTATTIDAVIEQDYVGGVILPGVQLMQDSLFQGTALLPEVRLPNTPAIAFPKATYAAIEAGIAIAQAGAVMRQVQKLYRDYQREPSLLVSGGARKGVLAEIQQAYQEWAEPLKLSSLNLIELENPVLDGIHQVLLKS